METAESTQNPKKQVQAKGWLLTWPQCAIPKDQVLVSLEQHGAIKEYVIASEKHQDGSPHVHAFIKYSKKVTLNPTKFDIFGHHGNYQVAKSWNAASKYCKKDGDFIANIDTESATQKKGKFNKMLMSMDPKQAVDDGHINAMQLCNLIKNQAAYKLCEPARDMPIVRGIWIHGAPGIGKSHIVRTNEPQLYLKSQSKWWDKYNGEVAVLLEDFDHKGECLSHYLKIWADKWACTGEIKGAHIPLNFERFYITSNYHPRDIFRDDPALLDAITRRFKIDHMITYDETLKLFK